MAYTGGRQLTRGLIEHRGEVPGGENVKIIACCFTHETTKEEKVAVGGGRNRERVAISGEWGGRRRRWRCDTRLVKHKRWREEQTASRPGIRGALLRGLLRLRLRLLSLRLDR
jgi:hypothetical protein